MDDTLKKQIESEYNKNFPPKSFVPGDSPIPITGKVFDAKEMVSMIEAVLEGKWTEGHLPKNLRANLLIG